jgi:GNAT superfamily N-acetyltransferase
MKKSEWLVNLTVRVVRKHDLESLATLISQLDGEAIASPQRMAELFARILEVPNYNYYIAYDDPDLPPVGCFSLLILPTLMHDGISMALLDAVVVRQDLRGQGIGKRMMQEVYRLCREAKCRRIVLSSHLKRERAHGFYRSLGFKQHGWSFSLEGFDLNSESDF